MFVTELHTHQVSDVYRRFADSIGDSHWKKRVARCKQAIKGNGFLREYLENENGIAYQLSRLGELIDRFGGISLREDALRESYPAASLAAQVLSLMETAPKDDSEKLRRRIHGALRNPADMWGLQLELSAATHFARRGKRISWAETTGVGTFDLLVEDQPSIEIECKLITDDKGRKIHRREMLEFFGLLKPYLWPTAKGLTNGLSVVLTVPGRLPAGHKERVDLAKALSRAVVAGGGCTLADGSTVRISDFDVRQLGDSPNLCHPRTLRLAIDGVTGTSNRQAVLLGTPAGGVLALAMQSARDDSFLKAVFGTLSDASGQLTRTQAGMLWVGFNGIDGEQLLSVAQQDQDASQAPSALRVGVSQFLSSTGRDHIVGVGFMSRSAFQPAQPNLVKSGGTAYYFPKRESSLWSESFSGMFPWASEGATQ